MQSKISLPWSAFALGSAIAMFSAPIIPFLTDSTSIDIQNTASVEQAVSIIGRPVRLIIPKIGLDATIERVGLTSDGALDAPKGPINAGWFDSGVHVGGNGTSVIDGHSGWKDGTPAVFDALYQLRKGDRLYVEDKRGVTVTFVVRELRMYDPNEDASVVFGSSDGGAHLNLITCAGMWDTVTKSSSNRLVVFADRE